MTEIFGKQYYYPNTTLISRISSSISRFYSSTGIVPTEVRISDKDFPELIKGEEESKRFLEIDFFTDFEEYRIQVTVLPSKSMMSNYVWVLFPEKEKEK